MLIRLFLFFLLNFAALALGGLSTASGVSSDWYLQLNKAPWTPPGWVFGAAWTTIMICFSLYLAVLWPRVDNKQLFLILFSLQWILNVGWNPLFFSLHNLVWSFVVIIVLTLLVGSLWIVYLPLGKKTSLLLLPYFIWLLIASSLNGYAALKN